MIRLLQAITKRIVSVFRKPKIWDKENPTDSPIVYAFTWEGVDYFCYENPLNMPWMRSFVAFEFMEEFNMRLTKDLLSAILAAMKEEINKPVPQLTEVVKWINLIEERMEWVVEPETLLKLASVHFFTREESPIRYDLEYNNKKIQRWKNSKVLDFFLQLPIKELAPFYNLPKESIQTYFAGQLAKTIKLIDEALGHLSLKESESSRVKELQSHREQLEALMSSVLA